MESRLIFKENFFCWLASHNLLFVFKYECSGLKSNILIFKGDVNFMSSLGVLIGPGINQCLYPICGHLIWFSATNNNFPCFYAFLVRKVSVFTQEDYKFNNADKHQMNCSISFKIIVFLFTIVSCTSHTNVMRFTLERFYFGNEN